MKSSVTPNEVRNLKPIMQKNFYVYIVTNPERTVLYTGMTSNLAQRIIEHYLNRGQEETFAGKYYCYNLIFYETYQYVNDAIARETEIKKWRREKKLNLIKSFNPSWTFLNAQICEGWPPVDASSRF